MTKICEGSNKVAITTMDNCTWQLTKCNCHYKSIDYKTKEFFSGGS
jgi:hypothetical protein